MDLWIHLKAPAHETFYGDSWIQLQKRIMGHTYNSTARGKFVDRDSLAA
ncbi:hypothetical protein M7I_3887 [Glarea lozoyensis 74030]|uniref:Uncharacterized protein n=1 Tax=Glarea lozoyensis (strain ATCC 74030 / MF5533) TaxID=1104152 RepID=H0EMP8_GLAL7|nr:hypothetical protein M7I_3887 [Glarea lozoyensis 74030]